MKNELVELLKTNGYQVTIGAEETLAKIKELTAPDQDIDIEPCICEDNKACTDVYEEEEFEFPDCFKANPTQLCCKYCTALNKTCNDPCAGIFKE